MTVTCCPTRGLGGVTVNRTRALSMVTLTPSLLGNSSIGPQYGATYTSQQVVDADAAEPPVGQRRADRVHARRRRTGEVGPHRGGERRIVEVAAALRLRGAGRRHGEQRREQQRREDPADTTRWTMRHANAPPFGPPGLREGGD